MDIRSITYQIKVFIVLHPSTNILTMIFAWRFLMTGLQAFVHRPGKAGLPRGVSATSPLMLLQTDRNAAIHSVYFGVFAYENVSYQIIKLEISLLRMIRLDS